MAYPGGLGAFATDTHVKISLDRIRNLNLDWPKVDVLESQQGRITWRPGLDTTDVEDLCQSPQPVGVRIFFVNSVSPNGNSNRYVNPATTESLERTGLLFRAMKMTMSGCLKRIYYDDGINVTRDSIGNIVSISAGVVHPDDWDRVYSTWTLTDDSLSALFLDYGDSISETFRALVEENPSRAVQPLLVEYAFIDGMFEWFHQRQIREINKMKEFEWAIATLGFEEGLKELTDIVTELGVLRAEVRGWQSAMTQLEHCERLLEEFAGQSSWTTQALRTIPGCEYSKSRWQLILKEIDNTEQRTNTQLTLKMHRASQELAQQSKELAQESKKQGDITALLAYETSADSASMMTIAAMTMLFLPATFVSSLFSMGFFAFNEGQLAVSPAFWMYPSIVLPLTIAVFAAWLAWMKFRPVKFKEKKDELYDELKRKNNTMRQNQLAGTLTLGTRSERERWYRRVGR